MPKHLVELYKVMQELKSTGSMNVTDIKDMKDLLDHDQNKAGSCLVAMTSVRELTNISQVKGHLACLSRQLKTAKLTTANSPFKQSILPAVMKLMNARLRDAC